LTHGQQSPTDVELSMCQMGKQTQSVKCATSSYFVTAQLVQWLRWMTGVGFPARLTTFSLRHRVQNSSGAHPAFYTMGTGNSFPGGKVP